IEAMEGESETEEPEVVGEDKEDDEEEKEEE
ncbi:50S ribosomal protein L25/general stress protein Ctc, partial [Staphylococcus aureus]|nr:50S ribosomal protein L25/general stress protein Ctc [Staphylococcus aureus]